MSGPPNDLPTYRLLTGRDDADFCRRVSDALALGYAPYHSKPISVADGEALHVLDGLLYHGADLNAVVHHTDGGGVSDHVFEGGATFVR